MAHICIVTDPKLFSYAECSNLIEPLLVMTEWSHELYQFEWGLALTNLCSWENTMNIIVEKNGFRKAFELVYSENERVQRVGLELINNICMHPETQSHV